MPTSRLGAESRLGPRDQQDQDCHSSGETEARVSEGPDKCTSVSPSTPALSGISGPSGLQSRLRHRVSFPWPLEHVTTNLVT